MANKFIFALTFAAAAIVSGCASVPLTTSAEPTAVSTALTRARFEMNCPEASATVLSARDVQPLVFGGPERAQFTVGVRGCGKQQTMIVLCSDNANGCFAADGQN